MPQSPPAPGEAFASLLDAQARLAGASADAHAEPVRRSATVHDIGIAGETPATAPVDPAEALRRAYADEEPPAPTLPQDCTPDALARELGLAGHLTAGEIERIRRRFALANHPDRVPASQRDLATRRMTIANMLVDQALAACRRKGRR
jgi:hypothetical protein